jgi:hypothetical protein
MCVLSPEVFGFEKIVIEQEPKGSNFGKNLTQTRTWRTVT